MPAEKNQRIREMINTTKYFGHFAVWHMGAMRTLQKGKLLGKGSEGWRNVAEHCLLAGVTAHALGRLLKLDSKDLVEITQIALTHDWDKRLNKEKAASTQKTLADGRVVIEANSKKTAEQELSHHGIARVTGHDLRDYKTWNMNEKIMRFVDSCLGTQLDGKAYLADWHERFDDLRRRNPKVNVEVGNDLYGGEPLFDVQERITDEIAAELSEKIFRLNPTLSLAYSSKDIVQILRDTIEDRALGYYV